MRNIFLSLWVVFGLSAYASAQTPYYQGKTIRFVVGYPAGSTHDLWARVVGPYMTKYIPGNPQTIVQNMPGAGPQWPPITFTALQSRMGSVSPL
jgi:tripartite-type tricarboxylate transporter receptor subunit TctC